MSDAKNTDLTPYALSGLALRYALTAQLEYANRLTAALIASGALSAQAADEVLRGTGAAVEKLGGQRPETPGKSPMQDMLLENLRGYAQGMRGVAKKILSKRG
jgi:hypothetical protein